MKIHSLTRIKIFALLISVLFVLAVLMLNTKPGVMTVHAQDGAAIYASSCVRCHGTDGKAQTPKGKQTGATNLASAKWKPGEARDIRLITNGKGKMPAFKATLSAEEIQAVWSYIRGRFK
jgi:mono/diheme cytochrome c family protein